MTDILRRQTRLPDPPAYVPEPDDEEERMIREKVLAFRATDPLSQPPKDEA